MVTYNFSSGPAVLPDEVLAEIRDDLPEWNGTGLSVMTVSHRSPEFMAVMASADERLRRLLAIPDDYAVLFLQGGAMGQFAGIPLNLTDPGETIATIITGHWSETARREAERMGLEVAVVADEKGSRYTTVPDPASLVIPSGARYLSYTPNETIGGVEFPYVPDSAGIPLVADASSQILSTEVDVARFGLIYAGAQKNLGIAGVTVVIVRRDLIGHARPGCPSVLDYARQEAQGSLLNTPPTFPVYVLERVLAWAERQGGVPALRAAVERRATRLYRLIDASQLYANPVDPSCRSTKNIPFTLRDPSLDAAFLAESQAAGLAFLAGHRSVGGMRASLYNAMTDAGVEALCGFMEDFEDRHR
ncbi:MAG: 3-phosphoserine/phosphohydroxythreonine transaminase [Propionibacteriaceae bacterium]|jgi:phosphoserine aminotransferase|nr:3-phosphoserine/phosphohydroxythreonine transaminase [Propionibacteriaceae bacterium]